MPMLVQASMCERHPGLGNRMFPWARAEVFASRTGARMIAPQWSQPKVGPMLRRETDLRTYLNLFDSSGYLRGPARWHALLRRPRILGEEANEMLDEIGPEELTKKLDGHVVDFRGYQGWFRDDLQHHRDLIKDRLWAITSRAVMKQVNAFALPTEIVAHVRRGDMRVLAAGEEFGDKKATAESEAYFIAVIEQLRSVLGQVPVTIFSNSRPGELTEIPKLDGVHIAPVSHSALTDIWLMSRATALISSSQSSFSAWSSYLGAMPTVWHRPYNRPLVAGRPELAIEAGPDGVLTDTSRAVVAEHGSENTTQTAGAER